MAAMSDAKMKMKITPKTRQGGKDEGEDGLPPIPLSVPADLSGNGAVLDEIQRQMSRRSVRSGRSVRYAGEGSPGGAEGEGEKGLGDGGEEEKRDLERDEGAVEGDEGVVAPVQQPKNNMLLVTPALLLITFISALDQTIIATALPTIAGELNASHAEYSWIGTSYLLAQTILTPINGRVSDITGRKPMLYASIGFLMVFSALCGAAQNITWLIAARFFAGLGGGSIVSLSIIIISDLVPLRERAAYQGYMGASYAAAGVLGPVLGGVITQKSTWRWCFYLNLPTCGVALVMLIFTLKLNRPRGASAAALRRSFDFLGLILIIAAAALLIVGFANAADFGFGRPTSYGFLAAGGVLAVACVVHSLTTKRNAIFPPQMLKNRTTLFFTFGSFMNSLCFLPANFLLPQYFQGVRGFNSLKSGEAIIPFSVTVALTSILAGQLTSRFSLVRSLIWTGFALTSLGYALFYALLDEHTSLATSLGIQIIPAAGVGLAIATPMLVLQAALAHEDMAASMSAWVLIRSIGAAVGLAVFTALLNEDMRSGFEEIPGYGVEFEVPRSLEGYRKLQELEPGLKERVLKAFADSFRLCWIIGCGLLGFALLLTLWTKSYSLDRKEGPVEVESPNLELDRHELPIVRDAEEVRRP